MQDLEALMQEVAYHRNAGECIGAFYEGLRTTIGEHELRLALTQSWMWHMYPNDDEEGAG